MRFGKDILQQLVVLWCALANRPVRDMGSEQILLDDMWDVVGLSLLNPLRLQQVIRGPPKGSIMADRGFVSARYEDA